MRSSDLEVLDENGVDLQCWQGRIQLLTQWLAGSSLDKSLEIVCRIYEHNFPGSYCSVHLLRGDELVLAAGPSLHPSYRDSISRVRIGPEVGSCGTAAYEDRIVISEDISTDPKWEGYRHLVAPYQFRSCWSVPIRYPTGKVIGTFAVYYKDPRKPSEREITLLSEWGCLIGLGILREEQRIKLQEARDAFRALFDNAPEAIVLLDVGSGKFVRANPAAESLFGLSSRELLQWGPFDLSPEYQPDGRRSEEIGRQWIDKALAGEQPVFEWIHRRTTGEEFHAEVRLLRMEWEGRTVIRGCILDISDRKKLEKQLAGELSFIQAIMNGVPCTVFLFDKEQRMLRWNRLVEQASEYSAEEISRMKALEFIAPEDHPRVIAAIQDVFVNGSGYAEAHLLTKSGKRIPYFYRGVRVTMSDGIQLLGMGVDLTERKQLESRLLHNEKMSCVGRLAAGIAHDFNNLLTVILGYSQLLQGYGPLQRIEGASEIIEQLRTIQEAAERARHLTNQLLAFSRQSFVEPRLLDLNDWLKAALPLLKKLIPNHIVCEFSLAAEPAIVTFDEHQLLQVLMNLCSNAVEAMPNGGKLRIAIEREIVTDKGTNHRVLLSRGEYAVVTVSDTGCGIPLELQQRVFEPFFTTKGVGKGTGLGLAVAHGIVQQHSGVIDLESTPGEGTTFRIYLPLNRSSEGKKTSDTEKPPAPFILVVDDEQVVRKFLTLTLQTQGYHVKSVSSATEALQMAESGELPELVVTDLVMPGMNGRELAEEFQRRFSICRFLFISGYTADAAFHQGLLEQRVAFLAKPFTPAALLEKVKLLLAQPSATMAS